MIGRSAGIGVVFATVVSLLPSSAFAQDARSEARDQGVTTTQSSVRVASPAAVRSAIRAADAGVQGASGNHGTESRFWAGLGLMAGGGALALYGFNHVTGAEVSVSGDLSSATVQANEKHATGVGVAGLAIAGVGAFLMATGHGSGGPAPMIGFSPGGVTVFKTVTWGGR